MNDARKAARSRAIPPPKTNKNETPPADVNAGIDELLLLKRNRAVVRLMRDEEALFDKDNFERRVQPPGYKARARIAFGLTEILEPDEAASLLAYLDERRWKLRFSLTPRDLRQTYKPRWFFRFVLFKAMWLVISLPFIPVNLSSLVFFNPDWTLIQIVLIICGAASVITSFVYYEFEERRRQRRVDCRAWLTENTEVTRKCSYLPCQWMADDGGATASPQCSAVKTESEQEMFNNGEKIVAAARANKNLIFAGHQKSERGNFVRKRLTRRKPSARPAEAQTIFFYAAFVINIYPRNFHGKIPNSP